MRISIKYTVAFAGLAILLSTGVSTAQAANKANGPCSKAGATATIAGKKYVCASNIMKKLTWMVPAATSTTANSKKPGVKPTIKGGRGGDDEGGEGRQRGGDDD